MARIVLVEDEAPLLALLERYLVRCGHAVRSFATASAAWEAFEAEPEAFELAVADLTLPDGTGDGLARRMLERNPALKVVVCTGYPFDLETLGIEDTSRAAYLQKPFLPRALGAVLEELGIGTGAA
jgi:DNA-binding NtrC family response regulator